MGHKRLSSIFEAWIYGIGRAREYQHSRYGYMVLERYEVIHPGDLWALYGAIDSSGARTHGNCKPRHLHFLHTSNPRPLVSLQRIHLVGNGRVSPSFPWLIAPYHCHVEMIGRGTSSCTFTLTVGFRGRTLPKKVTRPQCSS